MFGHSKENGWWQLLLLKGVSLNFPLPTMAYPSFQPGKLLSILQVTDCLPCKAFLNSHRELVPSSSVRLQCYVCLYVCMYAYMYASIFHYSPISFTGTWMCLNIIQFPAFITLSHWSY